MWIGVGAVGGEQGVEWGQGSWGGSQEGGGFGWGSGDREKGWLDRVPGGPSGNRGVGWGRSPRRGQTGGGGQGCMTRAGGVSTHCPTVRAWGHTARFLKSCRWSLPPNPPPPNMGQELTLLLQRCGPPLSRGGAGWYIQEQQGERG